MTFEEWAVVSVPIIKYVHPLMQLFNGLADPVSVGTTGDGVTRNTQRQGPGETGTVCFHSQRGRLT
jgi:hypothetical protein